MHSQSFVSIAPVFQQGKFAPFSMQDLLAEPSLFSCSVSGIKMLAGPIVKDAVRQIEEVYSYYINNAVKAGLSAVIDVRVQRLMPRMFPSIPGWHCDAVPRCTYHGQPKFDLITPEAFHVCLLLSNEMKGVSSTEYVNSPIKPKIWDNENVYKDLHRQVERLHPETTFAKDGMFTWFTPKTIHRASPTHRRGIRLFLRFSMYHKPPVANVVTGQQQVYLLSEENGW